MTSESPYSRGSRTRSIATAAGALLWLCATAFGVNFSAESGFYDMPFSLELTSDSAGGTVLYTLDGSDPADPDAPVQTYSGPILINRSTVVQARLADAPASVERVTRSFIFPHLVATQGNDQSSRNFPDVWKTADGIPYEPSHTNHPAIPGYERDAVYGVDPRVVAAHPAFIEDIQTLPALSLVMAPDHLFSAEQGIYANSSVKSWYQPASIEWIEVDGSVNFQALSGARVMGDFSRREDVTVKHGFLIKFARTFGAPRMIPNTIFPDSQAPRIERIALRSVHGDNWMKDADGRNSTLLRDEFANKTFKAMGHISVSGRFVNLYINGVYWGVFQATERPDEAFYEQSTAINTSQWDVMKGIIFEDGWTIPEDLTLGEGRNGELISGNTDSWDELFALAASISGTATNEQYDAIAEYLDIENFIDYMILNMYAVNYDWPQKNWYAASVRSNEGGPPERKWIFVPWDTESAFNLHFQSINPGNFSNPRFNKGPALLWRPLWRNAEFRMDFADRVKKHYFNGGALSATAATARFVSLGNEIERAIVGELARWAYWKRPSTTHTRETHWGAVTRRLRNEYFPQRTGSSLDQLRGLQLYPTVDAPEVNIAAGAVERNTVLQLSASGGTTYYTTDGIDPRMRGGDVSPSAVAYTAGQGLPPLQITTTLKARNQFRGQWSALTEARYTISGHEPPWELIDTVFGTYNDLGGGSIEVPWFGGTPIEVAGYPWVRHASHHWLYVLGEADNLWVYDVAQRAWWWTNRTVYPFLYSYKDNAWRYFFSRTINGRFFYDFATDDILMEP